MVQSERFLFWILTTGGLGFLPESMRLALWSLKAVKDAIRAEELMSSVIVLVVTTILELAVCELSNRVRFVFIFFLTLFSIFASGFLWLALEGTANVDRVVWGSIGLTTLGAIVTLSIQVYMVREAARLEALRSAPSAL
jgi:hypothetical protein